MEKLKQMKECLTGIVERQIYENIDKVDTKELGEVIDMIKDLAEAIYYCTITEAMNEDDERQMHQGMMYYAPKNMRYDSRHKESYPHVPGYAQKSGMNDGGSLVGGGMDHGMIKYPDSMNQIYRDGAMKDPHEGRSGEYRKMYMAGKGIKDKTSSMRELENYMHELSTDITEMIQDASPEEKTMLQQRIATLATKIK